MNLLDVENISKNFYKKKTFFWKKEEASFSLKPLSFHLKRGEILGIVGESGSGKSTLGKIIMGLTVPDSGMICFQGEPLIFNKKALFPFRTKIQMVFQDPKSSLNPRKNIFTTLSEPLIYHKILPSFEQIEIRVKEIIKLIGLQEESLYRYPHEFSGGQQQRIAIGRAIVVNPELIICDEAVSALDLSIQAQILNLLFELKQKLALSYIFISHDLHVIRHFCDRVLVMVKGEKVEEADTITLFENPRHPYTQTLLNSLK